MNTLLILLGLIAGLVGVSIPGLPQVDRDCVGAQLLSGEQSQNTQPLQCAAEAVELDSHHRSQVNSNPGGANASNQSDGDPNPPPTNNISNGI